MVRKRCIDLACRLFVALSHVFILVLLLFCFFSTTYSGPAIIIPHRKNGVPMRQDRDEGGAASFVLGAL